MKYYAHENFRVYGMYGLMPSYVYTGAWSQVAAQRVIRDYQLVSHEGTCC